MALFSRRTVQQLINRASTIVSPSGLQWHLKRLNVKKFNLQKINDVISSEWELAVLIGLSKLGQIEYEVLNEGTTHPDIFFNSQEFDFQFLADVRTVSDQNLHKENPCGHFEEELFRQSRKHNVPANRLSYDIKEDSITSEDRKLHTKKDFIRSIGPKLKPMTQDSHIKLRLPPKGKMSEFMNQNIVPFLQKISTNPTISDELIIKTDEAHVILKYNPKQKYFTGQRSSYTVTLSPDRNPVYRALENKSKQLRKSRFQGTKGVFLCDGDCHLLKNNGYAGLSYSIE